MNSRWRTRTIWTENRMLSNGAEVRVTFEWSDHGIGPYEHFGSIGNHSHYFAEVISVVDKNGKEVFDDLTEDVIARWEDEIVGPPENDD